MQIKFRLKQKWLYTIKELVTFLKSYNQKIVCQELNIVVVMDNIMINMLQTKFSIDFDK